VRLRPEKAESIREDRGECAKGCGSEFSRILDTLTGCPTGIGRPQREICAEVAALLDLELAADDPQIGSDVITPNDIVLHSLILQ